MNAIQILEMKRDGFGCVGIILKVQKRYLDKSRKKSDIPKTLMDGNNMKEEQRFSYVRGSL